MKKLAVLSIALLMLTTLVFADVMVEPAVTFSGSGTLTWGIDLDTPANHGFLNEASSNLTVTLVAASDATKGGAEGETVFGAISLTGMTVVLDSDATAAAITGAAATTDIDLDGDAATVDDPYVTGADTATVASAFVTAPTVEAYVMLGPAKWFIYAAPDLAVTFAAALEDDGDDDYWAEGEETDDVAPDFGEGATGIEIAAGPATIQVLVASGADWTAAASYGAGLKATLALGPATIDLGANYPFAGGPLGAGVGLGLTAGPATISAGFDMTTAAGTPIEVAGGVALALPDVATITADVAYSTAWNLDAEVGVTLSAIANLDAAVKVGLWNITSGLNWGVMADLGYTIAMGEVNYVKPAVQLWLSDDGAMRIVLIGSVEAVLIPNTTFVLTYTDKDLTGGTDRALTFATTVAY